MNRSRIISVMRKPKPKWLDFLDKQHFEACLCDTFWYIVVTLCNPRVEYRHHREFFQDRLAANFVSFMLVDDPKFDPKEYAAAKDQFFKNFYDIMAQGIYYALNHAFPISRPVLTDKFKRKLLNTISELYTGNVIYSAKFSHWINLSKKKAKVDDDEDADAYAEALAKSKKTHQEVVRMRYSPLVARYLMNHNYETINNVSEWRMKLSQRHQIQDAVDRKFKKFKKIAAEAVATEARLAAEYEKFRLESAAKLESDIAEANAHIAGSKASNKERLENGSYAQLTNMHLSIHTSKRS